MHVKDTYVVYTDGKNKEGIQVINPVYSPYGSNRDEAIGFIFRYITENAKRNHICNTTIKFVVERISITIDEYGKIDLSENHPCYKGKINL